MFHLNWLWDSANWFMKIYELFESFWKIMGLINVPISAEQS